LKSQYQRISIKEKLNLPECEKKNNELTNKKESICTIDEKYLKDSQSIYEEFKFLYEESIDFALFE